jgi:hypothetical protein
MMLYPKPFNNMVENLSFDFSHLLCSFDEQRTLRMTRECIESIDTRITRAMPNTPIYHTRFTKARQLGFRIAMNSDNRDNKSLFRQGNDTNNISTKDIMDALMKGIRRTARVTKQAEDWFEINIH